MTNVSINELITDALNTVDFTHPTESADGVAEYFSVTPDSANDRIAVVAAATADVKIKFPAGSFWAGRESDELTLKANTTAVLIPDGSRHMDGDHFAISVTPAMQTYNLSDCGFKIYAIRLPRTRAN